MSNSSDSESYKSVIDLDDAKSAKTAKSENDGDANGEDLDALNLRRTKFSRAEKKARRMLIKQGSKPMPNITRIVMRQAHMLFIIDEAEIYRSAKSDTFIVFGEVKIEDISKQKEQVMEYNNLKAAASLAKSSLSNNVKSGIADAEDDEEIDDTDVDSKDIELVMSQASTTRARAIKALKENDNDIVNAIMALTM